MQYALIDQQVMNVLQLSLYMAINSVILLCLLCQLEDIVIMKCIALQMFLDVCFIF